MGLDGGFAFWAAQGQSRVEGKIFLPVFFPLGKPGAAVPWLSGQRKGPGAHLSAATPSCHSHCSVHSTLLRVGVQGPGCSAPWLWWDRANPHPLLWDPHSKQNPCRNPPNSHQGWDLTSSTLTSLLLCPRNITLLHYLITIVEKKYPKVLRLHEELRDIPQAAKVK